nr:CFEM domain-containing protein [Colletotrichum truncatum]KAF6798624.1 CFEM domain-containing protein [Colletotrichum truncatum]
MAADLLPAYIQHYLRVGMFARPLVPSGLLLTKTGPEERFTATLITPVSPFVSYGKKPLTPPFTTDEPNRTLTPWSTGQISSAPYDLFSTIPLDRREAFLISQSRYPAMRLFSLFLSLAAVLSCAAAQGDATAAVASLPACAQSCLLTAVLNSPCQPTNQTCICTNAPLQAEVEVCVLQNCTLRQALTTKNITQTTCHAPVRDRTTMYNTISITMGTLSGVFVVIRIVHKIFATVGELGMDDWFILITLGSGIPGTVINTHGFAANGLGRDIWTVPFDKVTNFGYWFFVMEPMYFGQVTLLKMSLLFFYMRIFSHNKLCKKLIWGTIGFNAVFGITFIFVAVFQCSPISFYWTKWDLEHTGKCLDINAIAWANAGISIVLDFWMLALPLSQIRGLNLHWKKKIGVAMMFFVGTLRHRRQHLASAITSRIRQISESDLGSVRGCDLVHRRN